ncbi:hypothetical protein GCM10009557_66500 [Virgisporangium ochraceum]|uniref:DUF397 domain-containing protein n=1 Tax=Virgisporangium ochraceum TaxID=65505 RepID=A0A8J4E9E1_9ACTN|nr:DUF397 domain-containing protein [Virgisporangium ochraceum]GIJ66223.1 hypothetical protein Voc01_011400 [Virgisporangium ochraceum]
MSKTTPTPWKKSSYSGGNGGSCVEMRHNGDRREVRDSKLGDSSPILSFDPAAVADLVADIKDGRLHRG